MEKEGHMECKKSPSGHRYYVNKNHSKITLIRPKAELTMEEIVSEFNFLSEHGITNGTQLGKVGRKKNVQGAAETIGAVLSEKLEKLASLTS